MITPEEFEQNPVSKTLRLLEGYLEWTEDLVFVVDGNMIVRYVNHYGARPFRRDPEAIIGKSLSDLLPKEGFAAASAILKTNFTSGRTCNVEEKISFPSGELWLELRLSPILDEGGCQVVAVLVMSRDITERKQREALITHAKQSWEQAVDNMAHHIAVVDRRHRINRVNAAMARKLGITVQKAVGLTCYEVLHGVNKPPAVCPLLQPTAEGREYSVEIGEDHLGDNRRITISAVKDRQGRTTGCVYVGRDSTEMEEAATAKESSAERMLQLLRKAEYVVTIQDRDARYLFFSASPQFGMRAEEVIGHKPSRFFRPAIASRMVERVMTAAANGQPVVALTELNWNDETLRFLDQVSPIRDGGKEIRKVITISKKVGDQGAPPGDVRIPEGDRPALSRREAQVLSLIAAGFSSAEIAEKLFVSKKTVATHRARIMQKLDIHRTSALVRYAIEAGLEDIQ